MTGASPGDPAALVERALGLQEAGRLDDALGCYAQLLGQDPDHFAALANSGTVLHGLGRYAEAIETYRRALALRPEHAQTLCNLGSTLQDLNRVEEALTAYAQAIALEPDFFEARWNACLARLSLGDYERGFREYELRWQRKGVVRERAFPRPLWLGKEDVAGKRVLVHLEQGFGDALQFIRYAPLLAARGARVVVACHRALHGLLASLPNMRAVVTRDDPMPAFDLHVPVGSLPLAFGTTLATVPAEVPYLAVDPARIDAWRARLAPFGARRRIGIVWKGNPGYGFARSRACPVDALLPLLRRADCAFFSLQYGDGAADVAAMNAAGAPVTDYTPELGPFAEMGAFICALDLVVTVDTMATHLAGALGRPAWLMQSFAADWRWLLEREDSPWYPSVRLFRQSAPGDWAGVVRRVVERLDSV